MRRGLSGIVQPGYVEEGDGFVVESSSYSVVPLRRISKPEAELESIDPVPTVEYVVVWLLLLCCHGLCAAFLLAKGMIYFFMENPLMAYYANLLALPECRYFRLFGTLVGILGALHGLQLVLHLLWSIKSRSPAVFPRAAIVNRVIRHLQGLKTAKTQPVASASRSRSSITYISAATAAGLQDMLSVQGDHFALVFMIRKAAEAGAQIVQCYRYSSLISRVWINQVYAAVVVVNCWVTPALDYLMVTSDSRTDKEISMAKEDAALSIRERTICVTVDTLLTIMTCLALPLAIFVPYAKAFDVGWYGFPQEMLYNDVIFPNLIRENQALFALSFLDGMTKFIPHLSILLGTASISLILELYPPRRFKSIKSKRSSTVAVRGQVQNEQPESSLTRVKPMHVVGWSFFRRWVVPVGFITAGATVLGLHLHAAHLASTGDPATMTMCLQRLRPWFAVNVSCSILEYNCYTRGVLSPPFDVLDQLQGDAVTAIVFEHCPEFEMPPAIRRFPNLLGLELWNVSIVKWDADAALNADLHPNMFYLTMAYTNMTEMPRGLLTTPLPPLLGDIEISVTNLEVVPDELADAWSNVRLVYLEHAPLKEFPTALFKIPSLSVSLLDDGLETIPEDLFTTVSLLDEYLEICFSYNPIKNLPSSTRENVFINYLTLDHTGLTNLPTWANGAGQWINLGGCPICNDTEAILPEVADCTDWGWNPMVDGRFPLALVAQFRRLE
ncbi:hypothetical protein F441_02194 [Phytophthora nicotianae CJ01A1]|uniref:Uncharacterized protein n=2 Tax=Phytophthora nicotianae TaxID=4792 RepID=W2JPF8_PHYNI|nr:hypothetical protein L915_02131 [Phytophthora nicotianae]ETL48305.1 hypothetical protein L916_02095 [Phytophthora nicotianae]ETP24875.1 hypothetical protein F441_02194 [Phytophthora nicotianae CJ01A1]